MLLPFKLQSWRILYLTAVFGTYICWYKFTLYICITKTTCTLKANFDVHPKLAFKVHVVFVHIHVYSLPIRVHMIHVRITILCRHNVLTSVATLY